MQSDLNKLIQRIIYLYEQAEKHEKDKRKFYQEHKLALAREQNSIRELNKNLKELKRHKR